MCKAGTNSAPFAFSVATPGLARTPVVALVGRAALEARQVPAMFCAVDERPATVRPDSDSHAYPPTRPVSFREVAAA